MLTNRMNDEERRLWVLNDAGLYAWWKTSRMALKTFIRSNRAELTQCIRNALGHGPAKKTWHDYVR